MSGKNRAKRAKRAKQNSSTTIFDLPFDDVIVTQIAPHLKDRDLWAMWKASHGSQAFRELVEGVIGAKRRLCLSERYPDKELYPIAVKNCCKLRKIEINDIPWGYWDKDLAELFANNPLISKIIISNCTQYVLKVASLAATCKNLTDLVLTGLECRRCPDRLIEPFTKSKILLRHVTLFEVYDITEGALAAFFAEQPALLTIDLGYLGPSVRSALLTIGRTCRELEEISLVECDGIEDEGVWGIAENCPNLRKFDIHRAHTDRNQLSTRTIEALSGRLVLSQATCCIS